MNDPPQSVGNGIWIAPGASDKPCVLAWQLGHRPEDFRQSLAIHPIHADIADDSQSWCIARHIDGDSPADRVLVGEEFARHSFIDHSCYRLVRTVVNIEKASADEGNAQGWKVSGRNRLDRNITMHGHPPTLTDQRV